MAAKLPGNVQGAEWSRWETGRHRPKSDTLDAIAQLFDTTAADLMQGPIDERGEKPAPAESPLDALSAPASSAELGEQVGRLESELAELRGEFSEMRDDLQLVLSLLQRGDSGQEGLGGK